MEERLIIHGEKLRETIRDELIRALACESVTASEETEFYLVNLLTRSHEAGSLYSISDFETPMGVKFMEALSHGPEAKARELKEIGDTTLVALGLFAESVRRSIVASSYYICIGGSAYEALSGVVVPDEIFARIYAELAFKFASYVDVLARIAPWNKAQSDADILSIYRRWLATGDERLAEMLRDKGISLDREKH